MMLLSYQLNAQISVTSITPVAAVQNVLIGTGVTASNVQFTGTNLAIGKFTSTSASMPFSSGIVMSTGLVSGVPLSASSQASTDNGTGSDPQLENIATDDVEDAAVLEFDFIPESDTIKFRYVFGSEEYPEFVGLGVNDVFGFFISGANPLGGLYSNKNIALIPGTNTPVSIDDINPTSNSQYYINNSSSATLVYDGKSVILTAWAIVVPCTQYHIKLAIGDVGDGIYDSGVFLEANSFSSPRVSITPTYLSAISPGNSIEGCGDAQLTIKMPYAPVVDYWLDYQLAGTATRVSDYQLTPYDPDYIIIPAGQDSVVIDIHPIADNVTEPTEIIHFIVKTSLCYDIFDTVSVVIVNRDSLSLILTGDTLVCDGDSAHLNAFVTGGLTPYQYLWNNNVNLPNQVILPQDSLNTYVITTTDICGFQKVDSIDVVKSYVNIAVRTDTTICEGGNVLLSGSGAGLVTWTGLTGETPIVAPSVTTKYEATVSNICGTAKDTVTVYVDQIPYFSLGSDTIVCEQHPFVIGVPSNPDYQYLWSNGYPTSYLKIDAPNTYILNITNGVCNYSDTIIAYPGFCDWWIANSFSPDHSGLNEVFKPVGVPLPQYEMEIFDRWGELVFKTSDWNQGWDGIVQNQRASNGVYIYMIYGESPSSKFKALIKQGQVTILR